MFFRASGTRLVRRFVAGGCLARPPGYPCIFITRINFAFACAFLRRLTRGNDDAAARCCSGPAALHPSRMSLDTCAGSLCPPRDAVASFYSLLARFSLTWERVEGLPRSETHRTERRDLHVDRDLQPRCACVCTCARAISVTCLARREIPRLPCEDPAAFSLSPSVPSSRRSVHVSPFGIRS